MRICEGAFLHIVGLTSNLNASSATNQWKEIVNQFRDPNLKESTNMQGEFAKDTRKPAMKLQHAKDFILNLCRYFEETLKVIRRF